MARFVNFFLKPAGLLLIAAAAAAAEDFPRPPCAAAPNPPYAPLGAQPNVKVWNGGRQRVRIASGCPELSGSDARVVVALAGTFRFDGDADRLLERVGAVSKMQGIRYWSVTDAKWRELITESAAVESSSGHRRRRDFTSAELRQGKDVFFVQRDSRSSGEVVYRLRVLETASDRLVVETENVSPVKAYVVTLFDPGELHTIHFLTRASAGVWTDYALTLIGTSQSDSHTPSLVNRAAALYRYVAGQRTDQEPPLAR